MEERLSWRAWAWTVGAIAVFLVASFIPVPGIDQDALRAMAAQGGLLGLFNVAVPQIPIVQGSLGLLVVVRGLLRLVAREDAPPSPWATRATTALYVVASFGSGIVTAIWLESAQLPWGDPIEYPGWGTRLLVAVTLAAGAMLVWALATLISRRGVGQGPLVLFGAAALFSGATALANTGSQLELLDAPALLVLGRLASVAAPVVVLVAVYLFRPAAWPIRIVRGLHVTSPIDLLALPELAAAVVLVPSGTIVASLSAPGAVGPWGMLAHGLVTAAAAVAIAVALRRRSVGRGSRAWLVAAGAGTALALVVVVAGVLASGVLGRLLAPGPFDGDRTAVVELRADGGDGARDAKVLVQRLAELGLGGRVLQARRGLIRLEVSDVGDLQGALAAVLPPGRVTFRFVLPEQEPRFQNGTPPASEVASLLDPGPPVIGPADIADARVQRDPMDGRPNVSVQFTDAGAERFGEATAANVGRLLAMLVDEEVMSAPKVMEAIRGGYAQITLGSAGPSEQTLREAEGLAAALRSGPLGYRWAVASER